MQDKIYFVTVHMKCSSRINLFNQNPLACKMSIQEGFSDSEWSWRVGDTIRYGYNDNVLSLVLYLLPISQNIAGVILKMLHLFDIL